MTTGFQGTFVISWAQTGVDGLEAAPVGSLAVGSAWSWRGEAIRVDGSGPAPTAGWPDGETDMRRRAARMVQGIAGRALDETGGHQGIGGPGPFEDRSFVVTNGVRSYTITLIALSGSLPPLLMFLGEMPPRNTDLWVVHHTLEPAAPAAADPATPGAGGVICFTPGTRIAMADGRPIDDFENSLFLYTTVMSKTKADKAICDAGLKAQSVDSGPAVVFGRDDIEYIGASDEHGVIRDPDNVLRLGDKLRLVPGHCDPTVNIHDWYVGVRGGVVERLLPVTARGMCL